VSLSAASIVLEGRWGRIVDGLFVVGGALAVLVAGLAWLEGEPREAAANVVLVLLVALSWLRLRRRPDARAPLWTMSAAALVLSAVPTSSGQSGVMLNFAVIALVVLTAGGRVGLAYVLLLTSVMVGIGSGPFATTGGLVVASVLFLLIHLVAALLGLLVERLALSRQRTIALNDELRAANEQLRQALASQGELVLAEERARQARELHDGLGHRLTLVAMSLEFARRTCDQDPRRAWAEVVAAADTNQATLDDLRTWVRTLNPPPLSAEAGGAEALEEIADAFRGSGVDIDVRHEGDEGRLPHEVALFATRFVQEGLTNVLKHARARQVEVRLQQSGGAVRVSVRDDGDGSGGLLHDAGSGTGRHQGFGLRSLRERAALLSGSMSAGPLPGGGFEVAAELPMVLSTVERSP